jgi:hypothetical protein
MNGGFLKKGEAGAVKSKADVRWRCHDMSGGGQANVRQGRHTLMTEPSRVYVLPRS